MSKYVFKVDNSGSRAYKDGVEISLNDFMNDNDKDAVRLRQDIINAANRGINSMNHEMRFNGWKHFEQILKDIGVAK